MKSILSIKIIIFILSINCATQTPQITSNFSSSHEYVYKAKLSANDLEAKLSSLTEQIVNSIEESRKTKIAVIEFSDLDGKINDFGKFLAEELITRLFLTKKFDVIERSLLNKVIEEHRLKFTGLIDPETAKELGKILGVDAIATGTITDLVNNVKINSRLISTETGTVFAVAAVEIFKDAPVQKLMGKLSVESDDKSMIEKKIEKQVAFKWND